MVAENMSAYVKGKSKQINCNKLNFHPLCLLRYLRSGSTREEHLDSKKAVKAEPWLAWLETAALALLFIAELAAVSYNLFKLFILFNLNYQNTDII